MSLTRILNSPDEVGEQRKPGSSSWSAFNLTSPQSVRTSHHAPALSSPPFVHPIAISARPTDNPGSYHKRASSRSPSKSTSPTSGIARPVRPPRPSYSEEQKFFIMHARIVGDHTWPQIEDQYAALWERRSKGGLTSVYYRVRKDWGMMEVLKGGPDSFAGDCYEVEHRAKNFSLAFLRQIAYPL